MRDLDDEKELIKVKDERKDEKITLKKESHKLLNIIIFIIILIILLLLYAKNFGTKGLVVKEYRVESNILTKNYNGFKIVHFSDLLYKSTIDKNDIKSLIKKINELKPDIIVFTGNLVNKNARITSEDSSFLISELSNLNAHIGKYAIYGEYDYSYKDYEKVMDNSGFTILNNSYQEILYKTNEPLYLVGLPSSLKENIVLDEAFKFYDDLNRKYTIVLVSEGKTIKYLDDSTYEVDLILGGYSLNGSVVLPFYGGVFNNSNSYKYSKPEYKKGITNIYISSGLGTRDVGYRFLNKPSFNFYRLKAQS